MYVSHHVVVDSYKDIDIQRGDFIHFKAIIEEYQDSSNYGLYEFRLISTIRKDESHLLKNNDQILKTIETDDELLYGIFTTDICRKLTKIKYSSKYRLYEKLYFESIAKYIDSKEVPYNYFNNMILSLYHRQQREDIMYKKITEVFPDEIDLNNLIIAHMFVKYLIDKIGMTNPSNIFFNMVQLIRELTSDNLRLLADRLNCNTIDLKTIDFHIFKGQLLDNKDYHNDGDLINFSNYWMNQRMYFRNVDYK